MKLICTTLFVITLNFAWSQKRIIIKEEIKEIKTETSTEQLSNNHKSENVTDQINLELEVNELLNAENVDIRITETNGNKEVFIKSTSQGLVSTGVYTGEAAKEVQKIIDSRGAPYNQSEKLQLPNQKVKIKQKKIIKSND